MLIYASDDYKLCNSWIVSSRTAQCYQMRWANISMAPGISCLPDQTKIQKLYEQPNQHMFTVSVLFLLNRGFAA